LATGTARKLTATKWLLPEGDDGGILALASALGMQMPAARVLWSRGYRDAASAKKFAEASMDDLHSAALLKDMDIAVERVMRAIRDREKILLYGDYDVDGTSAVVILSKAIEIAGGVSTWHVPHRLRDGYGMRPEVIDEAKKQGVTLIISVDTGIRAGAVVAHARELGVDVIVTDHHLPEAELPPALAVLNPNRPDCGYPEKNLCGAAVAFKLVQAIVERLDWATDKKRRVLESFLKMAAIATVADVVSLTGENRIIVKHGLAGLRRVKNPGLRALIEVAGVKEGQMPSAGQVAFQIAPRINAAGRMANAGEVIELFLTEDIERAKTLAEQLNLLNLERRDTEAGIVEPIAESFTPRDDEFALVFSGEGWHRGVVGIAASRLVERYCRPVFVLGEENGLAQGSGRSIPQFHLLDALESMRDLFLKFGGHRQAAGVTLDAKRVPEFRERFAAYASEKLTPDDLQPTLSIDAVASFRELTDGAVAEVLSLAPFGFGHPTPVFASMGVEIAAEPEMKNDKHLFLRLRQDGRMLRFKCWNYSGTLEDFVPGRLIDVAFTVDHDEYSGSRGYTPWQTMLRGYRRSS
jgi:single-stranded-DNA-specific exonuclease